MSDKLYHKIYEHDPHDSAYYAFDPEFYITLKVYENKIWGTYRDEENGLIIFDTAELWHDENLVEWAKTVYDYVVDGVEPETPFKVMTVEQFFYIVRDELCNQAQDYLNGVIWNVRIATPKGHELSYELIRDMDAGIRDLVGAMHKIVLYPS